MFAIGGGMAIPMLFGLLIAQVLLVWMKRNRSRGAKNRGPGS
jgi:hypothetical protein